MYLYALYGCISREGRIVEGFLVHIWKYFNPKLRDMLFSGWRWTQQIWCNHIFIILYCTAAYWKRIIILVNQVVLFDFSSRRPKRKSIHKINRDGKYMYMANFIYRWHICPAVLPVPKTSVPHNPRWWGWAYFACSLPPSRLMTSKFLKLFFSLFSKLRLASVAGDAILCEFVFVDICETFWI
jgi:hypothetical protein